MPHQVLGSFVLFLYSLIRWLTHFGQDMCPPGCGAPILGTSPSLSLPSPPPFPSRVPPPIPTSSHKRHHHPSKLIKKKKGVLASSIVAN